MVSWWIVAILCSGSASRETHFAFDALGMVKFASKCDARYLYVIQMEYLIVESYIVFVALGILGRDEV